MRIIVKQIQSMKLHEATCHLLIMEQMHILLDCGISPSFDFSQYRAEQEDLKKVSVVLLTHSSLEYLGALPFLLTEFKITPQIYTTKPIAELGPLNIHEALLRYPKYSPEIYKRICLLLEDSVIKPLQKKVYQPNREGKTKWNAGSVQFVCFQAGNSVGSVCWRISYYMFNCLYLVGYNNFNQLHLNGMDVESVVADRTDLVITDCYDEEPSHQGLLRETVKKEVQKVIHTAHSQGKDKIIFSCYENQRIIQMGCVLSQLHKERKIEGKVDFIHCESSYLQSVKIYPQLVSKLEQAEDDPSQSLLQTLNLFNTRFFTDRKLNSKYTITTSLLTQPQGLLWPELCLLENKTLLVQMGSSNPVDHSCLDELRELFQISKPEPQPEPSMQIEHNTEADTQFRDNNDVKQIKSGVFIYNSGTFPQFQTKREIRQFDAYGEQFDDKQQEFVEEVEEQEPQVQMVKRKSTSHQNAKRIQFNMPPLNCVSHLSLDVVKLKTNGSITNFESSVNILSRVKAQKNLFINCNAKEYSKYEMRFKSADLKMDISGTHKKSVFEFEKSCEILDLPLKLEQDKDDTTNQSIKTLRVNGQIVQSGSQLQIRLQRSDEKEFTGFNMAKFYQSLKGVENTRFTQNCTVEIGGIKLSRKKNEITIEGTYSNEYFRLRQMLYEYIESS